MVRALFGVAFVTFGPAWAGAPAGGPPLRLPYLEGQAWEITQAPGGFITTHVTAESRRAIDFRMPEGTPVVAVRHGAVIGVQWREQAGTRAGGLGNLVRVRHEDGTIATYAHLEHYGVSVEEGELVWEGRILGYSGATGYASGPHLHFALTRVADGREVSLPVTFYGGAPPAAFVPRVGMAPEARYAAPAAPLAAPRFAPPDARALPRLVPHRLPEATPEAVSAGAVRLALAFVLLAAGMLWFYRFSRS
ncbi:MAG: M23 family metallopeptidase [Pseudomonadota bacterium]